MTTNEINVAPTERKIGKVTRIDRENGYGFIECNDLKFTRIYFSWQALDPNVNILDLKKDQVVSFELVKFPGKGYRALKVQLEA